MGKVLSLVERERSIKYCRFYGTGMVNGATPALDSGRTTGPSGIGRGWRGKGMKGIESDWSGEMQNDRANETIRLS